MNECPYLEGNPPWTCHRCDKPLPRRQDGEPHSNRRWCSRECSDEWARQHVWDLARRAALARDDYRCVRRRAHEDEDNVRTELEPLVAEIDAAIEELEGDERWGDEWRDLYDRKLALNDQYQARIGAGDLEVNHIEPRRGEGYAAGCHHHLDNLETLCHPCHVEVTTAQRYGFSRSAREMPTQLSLVGVENGTFS